ncbi:MAG: DUF3788 family protein [Thermoanaerobaculia bacterium]|jgi:hypothetical protein
MVTSARTKQVVSLSAFGEKTALPAEGELLHVLGPAADAWTDLINRIKLTFEPAVEQWNFAGAKYGWSLRLRRRDRVILYLIPQAGRFLVGIVLGAKAVAAARSAKLPARLIDAIAEAPRYAEGTGVRFPVSKARELPAIERLVALKMTTSRAEVAIVGDSKVSAIDHGHP